MCIYITSDYIFVIINITVRSTFRLQLFNCNKNRRRKMRLELSWGGYDITGQGENKMTSWIMGDHVMPANV